MVVKTANTSLIKNVRSQGLKKLSNRKNVSSRLESMLQKQIIQNKSGNGKQPGNNSANSNAIVKQSDPIGSGTVTANSLNVRNGPGTSYERIGGLTKGKSFQVYEEKDGWLKIQYGTSDGWISKQYTDYETPKPAFEPYDVMVTADYLNVRDMPGNGGDPASGSTVIGGYNCGTVVTVKGEQNGWFLIDYGGKDAWICGDWVTKYDPSQSSAVSTNGVPCYRQGDPAWGGRQLGPSGSCTIASHGCAMTATAMCLSKIAGYEINPATLDQYLDTHGGYTSDDCIYWGVAAGMIGCSASSLSYPARTTLDASLNAGRPFVIGVNGHYVCCAGRKEDGTYIIHDPGDGKVKDGYWSGSLIQVSGYSSTGQVVTFS